MGFTEVWLPWLDKMLYQNKYRTKSLRLKEWNYSNIGWYYVTICTKGNKEYCCEIKEGTVILNELGEIAQKFLIEIPDHFNNAGIDEYVIMPNHIHVIIVIKNKRRDVACNVSTNTMSIISPEAGSLSTIIRSYKSAVTNKTRTSLNKQFAWQSKFYDHIIRNEKSLFQIRKYILLNSLKWEIDKENLINN